MQCYKIQIALTNTFKINVIMKKSILLLLAVVLSCNLFAQSFDSSKLRVGGGLVYASDISNIGLTLNAVYSINEQIEGAFAFSHIFEKDYVTYNIFDFDGHYIFHKENEKLNFYGIAGLAVTAAKLDAPAVNFGGVSVPGTSVSESEIGLNIGAGVNYRLSNNLNLAPEARFTIMDSSYFRIGASIQYMF